MDAALIDERLIHEPKRLAALNRYDVLDTPRESDFDDIAELASEICGTPIAVVNLIGAGRQFFKAEVGLGVRETPLETSFCGHAILQDDFMMVADATKDPRFDCNPLVTDSQGLRFYAGALLKTQEGHAIGTLCVLDFSPRNLNGQQVRALKRLARQVMVQLELRRALKAKHADESYLLQLLDSTNEGFYSVDCEGNTTLCNLAFLEMLGFARREDVMGLKLHDVIHHSHPDGGHYAVEDCPIYQCAGTGRSAHVVDELFYRQDGSSFPVEYSARPIIIDGVREGAICTFVDITDRKLAQDGLTALNAELAARVAELVVERDRIAMMGREIDHRVMNSLQFVSALLAMQSKAAASQEISSQLDVAASRVATVARVHRYFYLDDSVETACALQYTQRLMADLSTVIEPARLTVDGESTPIPTTLIMPLGLILNELVTNAAKHGAKMIRVQINPEVTGVRLVVSDDGPGLPSGFDPNARKGLGMRVLQTLVRQHNGSMKTGSSLSRGAEFSIRLG